MKQMAWLSRTLHAGEVPESRAQRELSGSSSVETLGCNPGSEVREREAMLHTQHQAAQIPDAICVNSELEVKMHASAFQETSALLAECTGNKDAPQSHHSSTLCHGSTQLIGEYVLGPLCECSMWGCVCVSLCVSVCTCALGYRRQSEVLFLRKLFSFLETGSLIFTRDSAIWLNCLFKDSAISAFPAEIRSTCHHTWLFKCRFWGLNSSPYACNASA